MAATGGVAGGGQRRAEIDGAIGELAQPFEGFEIHCDFSFQQLQLEHTTLDGEGKPCERRAPPLMQPLAGCERHRRPRKLCERWRRAAIGAACRAGHPAQNADEQSPNGGTHDARSSRFAGGGVESSKLTCPAKSKVEMSTAPLPSTALAGCVQKPRASTR